MGPFRRSLQSVATILRLLLSYDADLDEATHDALIVRWMTLDLQTSECFTVFCVFHGVKKKSNENLRFRSSFAL